MPKQKTHKGLKKRFTVSGSGKVKRQKAGRGHLMSSKSGKRIRGLRKKGVMIGAEAKKIRELITS